MAMNNSLVQVLRIITDFCQFCNCLRDNIFITAGKRSATRGCVRIERQSEGLNQRKVHSFGVLLYMVACPAAALRLRPVMQITSSRRFLVKSV